MNILILQASDNQRCGSRMGGL